jgi:hypothetical protein
MVLGPKIFEGKGKSGASFIKWIGMEGISQIFTWTAELKGVGQAKGVDGMVSVTAKGMSQPKGPGVAKDQGMFNTMAGDMGVIKGYDVSKMVDGKGKSVGLWTFMTMSEKLVWLNDMIALVTYEAMDPMWQEFKIEVYEWKV